MDELALNSVAAAPRGFAGERWMEKVAPNGCDDAVGRAFTQAFGRVGEGGHGGSNATLINAPGKNERTMALYVPYATTIFDFTRRAMPWPQPKSLSNDEAYALTAFILAGNKIIGENDTMNAEALPKVRMPNRDGFVSRYPDKH